MSDLSEHIQRSILSGLGQQLGLSIVLTDDRGRVSWFDESAAREFPGLLSSGRCFPAVFSRPVETPGDDDGLETELPERGLLEQGLEADVVKVETRPGEVVWYRHLEFPSPDGGTERSTIHCLVDASREKRLSASYRGHLQQLTSMREIIETLYRSVSTQEVLYLILIAVTSQVGFGFNRAFYLEAHASRLRGRIGIGPSSPGEAHRIWSRIAHMHLSTLRSIYEHLTAGGSTPDPQTQEIALALRLPLPRGDSGLGAIIESGQPSLIHRADGLSEDDRTLLEHLDTDVVAVVPLYVRENLAGILIADNFVTRREISEESLSVLKTFSRYAGVALERSQLYDELRESVAKLQTANETLKTHQRKLVQAEKLSAIGQLAACVSHEIRNPMVAIGGLARSLLKSGSLNDDDRPVLEMIVAEIGRLERFLKETLDFVKPEVVGAVSLDLRSEVESCLLPFHAGLEEDSISLDVHLGDEPLRSVIDPDLLRRALSNLIKNAAEAIGEDGTIRIRASRDGYSVRIEVADTGPGIPPDVRASVFEPFFTTKDEGTGLGLAIAAQAVRSLGGEISLQDDDDFRTIFQVTLPLEEPEGRGTRGEESERREKVGT